MPATELWPHNERASARRGDKTPRAQTSPDRWAGRSIA